MFNKNALANSLAVVTAVVYAAFYVLRTVIPDAFEFLFNAQFFGADIAALIPRKFSTTDFVWTVVAVAVLAWVVGYLWAWLYNRFAKKG